MPGSAVNINRKDSYVGDEAQSNTVKYPGRRDVMAPTVSCEPCRFADNCWRPLCLYTHTGNGRSKKWAAVWNLLAEQEDALHSPPRLLQIRRRDFSVKHWLPQWSGYGERTSGDDDDIINATAEPIDIDEASADETDATKNETVWNESSGHETERHGVPEGDPPGHGGGTAGETDGNDNETKVALRLTQDGPPGNLWHNKTNVDATQGGPPGNLSHKRDVRERDTEWTASKSLKTS